VTKQTAAEQIIEEVTSWPGVEAGPGRRGEFAFRVGGREIGHLHGGHAAHFAFPKQLWRELCEQGRIAPPQAAASRERASAPRRMP
jgi:Luciferase